MAQFNEWAKGITVFLFVTIMFYFYWDNIFYNLINFAGTDFVCGGESACTSALSTSYAILKTIAWTSFIFMYLLVGPVYLFYAILSGSRNDVDTDPKELIKGIGIWAIGMPLLSIILAIMYRFIESISNATQTLMDTGSYTMASNFSWMITLLVMGIMTIIPFIYIMRGYGAKMMKGEEK